MSVRSLSGKLIIGLLLILQNAALYAAGNNYQAFNFDVMKLCADPTETLNTLKSNGYKNIGYGKKAPKMGMINNTSKKVGKYRYDLRSVRWNKGKVNNFVFTISGKGAYEKHFDAERNRIETQAGIKMECKTRGKNRQCLYRDRKTYTNIAINAATHDPDRIGIMMTSGCK